MTCKRPCNLNNYVLSFWIYILGINYLPERLSGQIIMLLVCIIVIHEFAKFLMKTCRIFLNILGCFVIALNLALKQLAFVVKLLDIQLDTFQFSLYVKQLQLIVQVRMFIKCNHRRTGPKICAGSPLNSKSNGNSSPT